MNILYYECFSGISGYMNLGAMVDLGVDPSYLRTELSKLGFGDEFELKITIDAQNGISGTRVDVVLKNQTPGVDDKLESIQPHHHRRYGNYNHRNFSIVEEIILGSELEEKVKRTGLDILRKVAAAEAKVSGKELHEVHFHEVGATDSIVAIMGAAICFHWLRIDEVWSSTIELGGGFVECAQGIMPVPVPATIEILLGCPTTRGAVNMETTTPTGAAILASLVTKYTDSPKLTVDKVGYGIGHHETEIPNVLRVHLVKEASAKNVGLKSAACVLQCNIDDMTPEMLGVMMELLLEAGAMDLHFTPIMMKKNRPATSVSLLCSVEEEDLFKRLLFRHTTTLGIKSFPIEKTELERSFECLDTSLGKVTMKNALIDGEVIRSKPELEECKEIARRNDIPLREVYFHISKKSKF